MINPTAFLKRARVVRWIDPDTVLVDPLDTKTDEVTRVRLKDAYLPEKGTETAAELTAKAERDFPLESYVWLTNERHHFSHDRLEARIDPAPSRGGVFNIEEV
jgi:hypothetical protein